MVSAAEGAVFHNRLTHTLEVAQVSRRLAQMHSGTPEADRLGGIDPEVVEAAGLAHDLGHPPFGHIGEAELDRLVVAQGVGDGFEGNAQTFRILTRLETRRDAFPGLNLTRAVLNAVLKYPWLRGPTGTKQHRKFGAYRIEQDDFVWAREPYRGDARKGVEAELMDWADDLAYAVHDVEDFYRAGLIPLDRLATDAVEVESFFEEVFARWKSRGELQPHSRQSLEATFRRMCQWFPETPYGGTREERAGLRSMTSRFIDRYINALRLRIPRGPADPRVRVGRKHDMEIRMLKELTWHYVITNPSLAAQQHGQRRVIAELFEVFREAANSNRDLLPVPYRRALEELEGATTTPAGRNRARTRVTADIIASMTEKQALEMHQRLTGRDSGTVLYRILY